MIQLTATAILLATVFFSSSFFAAEKLLTMVHTNDMHSLALVFTDHYCRACGYQV